MLFRRGYTLFELMLVLAVLLVAATLAFPLIEPMLASNRLTAARDMVRARWAEMRGRAMQEGRSYRFAVTENTGWFRIAPDEEGYWSGDAAPSDEVERPLILEGELPEGVVFATSDATFADGAAPSPGPEFGLIVAIYLSDGTARDNAQVWFGKAGSRPLGLQLRGLTGAVSAIERGSEQEVAP